MKYRNLAVGDLTGQQRSAGQGQLQHQEEPELPRGAGKSLLLCTDSEANGMSSIVCVRGRDVLRDRRKTSQGLLRPYGP